MSDLASVQITVYGQVQGVFFRAFAAQRARELGLTGYVRNLPDWHSVRINAEGERKQLEKLIDYLKVGPPTARVTKVATEWSEYNGSYSGFDIRY
jgi:acylphosphatase